MLTKLLFRSLPAYYPPRSTYAHFPFLDPVYMRNYLAEHNPKLVDQYIWTRPTVPERADDVVVVKTAAGVRAVLDEQTVFPTGYAERLEVVTGRPAVNHTFVRFLFLR